MPIEDLRTKIDEVDKKILALIEKRVHLTQKIGQAKKKKGLPVYDPKREEEILSRLTANTTADKDFIRKTFTHIIKYCRENEK